MPAKFSERKTTSKSSFIIIILASGEYLVIFSNVLGNKDYV